MNVRKMIDPKNFIKFSYSFSFSLNEFCNFNKLIKIIPLNNSYKQKRNYSSETSAHNFQSSNSSYNKNLFDIIVIGGGIVGITTARALLIEKPNLKVAVLEKESDVAVHQSGHNSGVIHAGIYYKTQSLKARLCVRGLKLTYEFCDKNNIPYKKCGKLVVATDCTELSELQRLYMQGVKNGAENIQIIKSEQIKKIEPHCQGIAAIHSPNTGIINWASVTKQCAMDFKTRGGVLFCNFEVVKLNETKSGTNTVDTSEYPLEFHGSIQGQVVRSRYAITCAGLYSDKVAEICSGLVEPVIIPVRGEYLELKEEKRHLIKGNIYPVPDPKFPFLGVHFTPRLDGNVWIGPSALIAFSREGYRWKDINKEEFLEMIKFPGFRALMKRYALFGAVEFLKSYFVSLRLRELQKYIPEIRAKDIVFNGATGVRAQALDDQGSLIDDLILELGSEGIESRILHCRNAPSPAATSSLALSEYIAKNVIVEFEL